MPTGEDSIHMLHEAICISPDNTPLRQRQYLAVTLSPLVILKKLKASRAPRWRRWRSFALAWSSLSYLVMALSIQAVSVCQRGWPRRAMIALMAAILFRDISPFILVAIALLIPGKGLMALAGLAPLGRLKAYPHALVGAPLAGNLPAATGPAR